MKPFNLKDVIKERAQIESNYEWAHKENPPLPKKSLHKCDGIRWDAGWYNFVKVVLKDSFNQLNP